MNEILLSKSLCSADYEKFTEHAYFKYLLDSWGKKNIPFRFEHEHRLWEYGLFLNALKRTNSVTVLDVGGGNSLLSPGLAEFGYEVTQINADSDNETCKKQNSLLGLSVEYVQADFLQVKSRKKYDAVACISVIEHVEEHNEFLLKLFSMVKSKGLLFLTTDFSSTGDRHSLAHLRTYNEDTMLDIIKTSISVGFNLFGGECDYKNFEPLVYDYTFASVCLIRD